MEYIFWLVFAHLVADYPLQGDFLSAMKGKNPIILVTHGGIWAGTIMLALTLLGFNPGVLVGLQLFFGHIWFDWLKADKHLWYTRMDSPLGWELLIDQSIHIVQCILAIFLCMHGL